MAKVKYVDDINWSSANNGGGMGVGMPLTPVVTPSTPQQQQIVNKSLQFPETVNTVKSKLDQVAANNKKNVQNPVKSQLVNIAQNYNQPAAGGGGTGGPVTPVVPETPAENTETPADNGPSQEVYNAQMLLEQLQNGKPEPYNSKYGPQLEALMQQIMNPRDFKWDFNGDELFKSYADLYAQSGRQASMDAMGQAAALTGGYGNSYAQMVGNQANDEWMRALYDKGLEFRDRAYEEWLNEGQELYNQLNMLQNADQTDYNRYRNDIADWQTDRSFMENVREFDESLNWDKMSSQQRYAAEYALQILAMGKMPSTEMLQAAGISAEDAAKMMAQVAPAGGGGGGGSKKSGTPTLTAEGLNGELWRVDENGNIERDKDNRPVKVDPKQEDVLILNGDLNNKLLSWMGVDVNQGDKKKNGNYTPYK